MYVPDIELHVADSLQHASALVDRYAPDARLLAGGTDLLVDLKTGRAHADHLVSLRGIECLRGVHLTSDDGLRIGAMTTVTQLAASPIVRERFAPILDATSQMAAPQVRNVATIGGNIASAVPCADLPPILMALLSSVVLWSPKAERIVPLDDFFIGPRQTVWKQGELISAILVPKLPPGFGAAYARLSPRAGNSIAVASVAASLLLNGGHSVRRARIVLGAVAPIPKRATSAEAALEGVTADQAAFCAASAAAMERADPISDVRGSADYRRRMVGVLTGRALRTALVRASEARS